MHQLMELICTNLHDWTLESTDINGGYGYIYYLANSHFKDSLLTMSHCATQASHNAFLDGLKSILVNP